MTQHNSDIFQPLTGTAMWAAGFFLALSNFIVVLDMTIANVSVPHIAGGLAISPIEGTYVITSYAVAEAISVPLTGWISMRFGVVWAFSVCIGLFGLFSVMCGLSQNLTMLVLGRALQGLSGGPLMPLSQTLMLRVFPPEKRAIAIAIWGTTTLVAPIMGPIVGGYICDNYAWPYIFFINLPITIFCSFFVAKKLKNAETQIVKLPIDFVGLFFLVLWVGCLQFMLDEGKNYDWFESNYIITLCCIAFIGFVCFLIWELTEKNPIVDLRVFRHQGFTFSVLTMCMTFAGFYASIVLTPLWLQSSLGYTATTSGLTTAMLGVLAFMIAPMVAKLTEKFDKRALVCFGVSWMALWTIYRSFGFTSMMQEQISLPLLIQGIGMPFFFLPLTGLALASVKTAETASAAGLLNFSRTLSGAFATSLATTSWENKSSAFKNDIVSVLDQSAGQVQQNAPLFKKAVLDYLVNQESIMLSLNAIFYMSGLLLGCAALVIWLVPRTTQKVDTSAVH